jgi:hypothetical protein
VSPPTRINGNADTVCFDATVLIGARFHRVVITGGVLAAEFLPLDFEGPRIVLDEDQIAAASMMVPRLKPEYTASIAASGSERKVEGR